MADVKMTAEIGRSGLQTSGGEIIQEYDPDLRGLRGVRVYDEMRKSDATVGTGLEVINWVIGQVNWHVEPAGETPPDKDAAEFLETCMADMSETWRDFISDVLTMLPFGWAWLEMVLKLRNGADGEPPSQYNDGKLGWRKFLLIGQDSLQSWEFDETGSVKALKQTVPWILGGSPTITIPIEKSVLFRMNKERGNPEGLSMLRRIYRDWYAKKNIEEIECIGIERDLTGVLIIHLPVGAVDTDKDKAIDLLEQYKADDMTGFVAPRFGPSDSEGWKFEIINSPGSKQINTNEVIRRKDYAIMRGFMAQFLMLGEGKTGSWALASEQAGTFEMALGAIIGCIEETVNRFAVPVLFRVNDFGQLSGLPQIKAGRLGKRDIEKFSNAMDKFVTSGTITPDRPLEEFIRDEFELPALPEMEEKEVRPEESGQDESKQKEATETDDDDWPPDTFREVPPDEWEELTEEEARSFGDVDWNEDIPLTERGGSALSRIFAAPAKAPIDLLRKQIDKESKEITRLARLYSGGAKTKAQFITEFQVHLTNINKKALQMGQKRLTPGSAAISRDARQLATEYNNKQLKFMRNMVKELDDLSQKQLEARSRLYMQSSEGLYHQVVAKGQDAEMMATWHLNAGAEHCEVCPGRDGRSWPANKMPFYPRDGNSSCLCITSPESRVLTKRGWKSIKDIALGEMVMTHRRRWRPVTQIIHSAPTGQCEAHIISPSGIIIGCTADHHWLTPEGWQSTANIAESELQMYTIDNLQMEGDDAEDVPRLWSNHAVRQKWGVLQNLFRDVLVWSTKGFQSSMVFKLLQSRKSVGSLAWTKARSYCRRYSHWGFDATQALQRLAVRIFLCYQGGWEAICRILGWFKEAVHLPLSLDLGATEWSYPNWMGNTSQGWRPFQRCFREYATAFQSRPSHSAWDAGSRESKMPGMDMPCLRHDFPTLSPGWSAPQILFKGLLRQDRTLYDLEVAEDHSFILEGLVAHNSQCKCYLTYEKKQPKVKQVPSEETKQKHQQLVDAVTRSAQRLNATASKPFFNRIAVSGNRIEVKVLDSWPTLPRKEQSSLLDAMMSIVAVAVAKYALPESKPIFIDADGREIA